jgi:hypothetical protein
MAHKLPAEQIGAIYRALTGKQPEEPGGIGDRGMRAIAKEGWALNWLVEDLLLLTDRRFDDHRIGIDLVAISSAVGYPQVQVCHRPLARARSASLYEAWSSWDAAGLFIFLEKLGFAVDPRPLVEALKPTIPRKGYIAGAALEVLWYEQGRAKSSVNIERQDPSPAGRPVKVEVHRLRAGYTLCANLDDNGDPVLLTVTGPRHREERRPVQTTCAECGATWWKGDPESSFSHRREHKKRMALLDPQPSALMLAAISDGNDPEHVDRWSPEWKHKEMYARAVAFKREFRYDFVQWDRNESDPTCHGFLFSLPDGRIVGACAFRMRSFEGDLSAYGLQWIWIAPAHRRRGVLRERWANLRERFGDFYVEPPVSQAMQDFLASVGDEGLLEFPIRRVEA